MCMSRIKKDNSKRQFLLFWWEIDHNKNNKLPDIMNYNFPQNFLLKKNY